MLRQLIISQVGVVSVAGGMLWKVFKGSAITPVRRTRPFGIRNLLTSSRIQSENILAQVFPSHRSVGCVILIASHRSAHRRHVEGEASAGFSLVKFVLAFSTRETRQTAYAKWSNDTWRRLSAAGVFFLCFG